MFALITAVCPLCLGWIADRILGDPEWLPHPVAGFGRVIAWGEEQLNRGRLRVVKGGLLALVLVGLSFLSVYFALRWLGAINAGLAAGLSSVIVFYCLAGKTLITEVKEVFAALDSSVEEGRRQVGRIVGRDVSALDARQIRTAALETLSENLSDGVVAPLFWYMLLGAPGMFAYKMVNTLDSMIGYKTERCRLFGRWAARIDDVANFIPARLTAAFMILLSGRPSLFCFVRRYARSHASPNAGYPESALAGVLDCRFGGPSSYFGELVCKPYIGDNPKTLTRRDMETAVALNRSVELAAVATTAVLHYILTA
ncbi:MAG: adenosylcobinamide-phosphate synthase CbiB [Tannerellaceae bacterium]|nr:adenosylcobinamide-phosphate synthase CbiB [Tannerellaceae bacterium]